MAVKRSRLQKKREKESLRQASKYLLSVFVLLFLLIRFGLPALVRMAAFLGDIRSTSEPIERQDTLAPAPPRLTTLPEATSNTELTIAGFAEAGTSIQLYLRGISADDTVTNTEGEFKFERVHLREGDNEIYAVAEDSQGNTSDQSASLTVLVDTKEPDLKIDSPQNGDRFFDSDSPITITGQTEEDVNITINDRFVLVKNEGSFETKITLSEGDNEIKVVATDQAGNQTTSSLTVNYSP